jgi:hypothetical protein
MVHMMVFYAEVKTTLGEFNNKNVSILNEAFWFKTIVQLNHKLYILIVKE